MLKVKRNFPSFIEAFMDYTKDVEAPESFLRWSAVSIVAGALERKVWVVFNNTHIIYPNEYIMLIGPPGLAKKSSSSGLAYELLQGVADIKFMSTQVSAASLVDQFSKAGTDKTIKIGEHTYFHSSLYVYSSEAAVTLKELTGGGSIIELLTDFYDCAPAGWHNDRAWSKETMGGGRTSIFNPCLNMLACSTPDWIVKSIGRDAIQGGFASRILFVVQEGKPERSVGWIDDTDTESHNETKLKLIQDLHAISTLNGKFKVTKDFKDSFNAYKRECDAAIVSNTAGDMAGYYARKLWHIMKLAQVMALDKSDQLVLSPEHLDQAARLLRSIEPNMSKAFGSAGYNTRARHIDLIYETIKAKGAMSKRDIARLFYKDLDSKGLEDCLQTLITMGRVTVRLHSGMLIYSAEKLV